jgi:hypothetical protein
MSEQAKQYEVVVAMGQFWVQELSPDRRMVAMCTRREDADDIMGALNSIEHRVEPAEVEAPTCPKCKHALMLTAGESEYFYRCHCGYSQKDPRQRPPYPAHTRTQPGTHWECIENDHINGLYWKVVRDEKPVVRCFEWADEKRERHVALLRFVDGKCADAINGIGTAFTPPNQGTTIIGDAMERWGDMTLTGAVQFPASEFDARVAALKARAEKGTWPRWANWSGWIHRFDDAEHGFILRDPLHAADGHRSTRTWNDAVTFGTEITEAEALALCEPKGGTVKVEATFTVWARRFMTETASQETIEIMADGTLRWRKENVSEHPSPQTQLLCESMDTIVRLTKERDEAMKIAHAHQVQATKDREALAESNRVNDIIHAESMRREQHAIEVYNRLDAANEKNKELRDTARHELASLQSMQCGPANCAMCASLTEQLTEARTALGEAMDHAVNVKHRDPILWQRWLKARGEAT